MVDDGSTDNSRAVIEGYGRDIVTVFKQNGGQSSTFNAGFARSSGEIICFLDADDLFLPNKVERIVGAYADEATGGASTRCSGLIATRGLSLIRSTSGMRPGRMISESNTRAENLCSGHRPLPASHSGDRFLRSCFRCRSTFASPATITLRSLLLPLRRASTSQSALVCSGSMARMHTLRKTTLGLRPQFSCPSPGDCTTLFRSSHGWRTGCSRMRSQRSGPRVLTSTNLGVTLVNTWRIAASRRKRRSWLGRLIASSAPAARALRR